MTTEQNKAIVEFYRKLDRSFFLDDENKHWANLDSPLPIGFGQTISQPSLVLKMTCQLAPAKSDRILEIGTGSGYQTALLAEFAGEVCTVERISSLSRQAQERLEKLGYVNISYKIGDGSDGWPEFAPYDKIIVTAAAARIPDALIEQLKPGGQMIVPVGIPRLQDLLLITRDDSGKVSRDFLAKVVFVELKGKYGWSDE